MCKKGILISIILTLTLTLMFPFSISANGSLSAPFVGFNVNITAYDIEYRQIKFDNITVDSSTDSYYVYVSGQLNCSNPSSAAVSQYACDVYELENQSGNQTGWTFQLKNTDYKINGVTANLSNSYTSFIYEIECVLDGSYVGWVTLSSGNFSNTIYVNGDSFKFTQMTNAETSYSVSISDYSLSKNNFDVWSFPIESFSAVNYLYSVYPVYGLQETNDLYTFPIFYITGSAGYACRVNKTKSNDHGLFAFAIDKDLTESNFLDYFYFQQENASLVSLKTLQPYGSGWGVYLAEFVNPGANVTLRTKQDIYLMPIYSGLQSNKHLSTEFALTFGLSNDLLDTIVYGTNSSNQSSSNLDSSSSSMNTQMNNLINIEDGYNQQFNNSLNQIDFTSPTGNQNLLSSANFVITVFNGLIQNNFLSTLIIIICILIIGKKVIGK